MSIIVKRSSMASATIIGRSHLRSHMPCQDYAFTVQYRNRSVAVVCDGAGSASQSHLGAQFCAHWLGQELKQIKDKLTQETKHKLIEHLQNDLKAYARELKCDFNDLSCTIIAVILSPYGLECLQLGDSILIAYHPELDPFSTPPMNGEYSNQTYFITHPNANQKTKIYYKPYENELLILCTDGVSYSLLSKSGENFAPIIKKLYNQLKSTLESETNMLLQDTVMPLFQKKTFDDCGIALIYEVSKEISASNDTQLLMSLYEALKELNQQTNSVGRKEKILAQAFFLALQDHLSKQLASESSIENVVIKLKSDAQFVKKISLNTHIPQKTVLRTLRNQAVRYHVLLQRS